MKQVRVDQFPSEGSVTRVLGRSGHVISTEKIITAKFDASAFIHEENDPVFDYDDLANFDPPVARNRRAHLPAQVFIQTDQPVVNRAIDKLQFRPLTCDNDLETFPCEQAAMLPYLCEDRCRRNAFWEPGSTAETSLTTTDGVPALAADPNVPYRYHPHEVNFF